jgi:hypothetical protein
MSYIATHSLKALLTVKERWAATVEAMARDKAAKNIMFGKRMIPSIELASSFIYPYSTCCIVVERLIQTKACVIVIPDCVWPMSWRLRWNVLASHIRTGRWISLRLLTIP